ncbi:hypothetical protein FOL47_002163 [Perkinsus chesapeaki]|uniref:Uncharacterized protein n=1 Tax=Perkinsus chesapeaki TaxID=330153 RepID=A0A7J6MFJ1_PERCH|nr:hypothetical protein FOL47_002163 [Perkinsus chesapeaki]
MSNLSEGFKIATFEYMEYMRNGDTWPDSYSFTPILDIPGLRDIERTNNIRMMSYFNNSLHIETKEDLAEACIVFMRSVLDSTSDETKGALWRVVDTNNWYDIIGGETHFSHVISMIDKLVCHLPGFVGEQVEASYRSWERLRELLSDASGGFLGGVVFERNPPGSGHSFYWYLLDLNDERVDSSVRRILDYGDDVLEGICSHELLSAALSILLTGPSQPVVVVSDSVACVRALRKMRRKSAALNCILEGLMLVGPGSAAPSLYAQHLAGELNILADQISRSDIQTSRSIFYRVDGADSTVLWSETLCTSWRSSHAHGLAVPEYGCFSVMPQSHSCFNQNGPEFSPLLLSVQSDDTVPFSLV